jgi:peptide/nickel transport system permease protein
MENTMRNFILRRLLQTLPMLLLASLLIFFIFALTPGDFIDGNINLTPQRAAELRALYGLDQPLLIRYWHWLGQLLQGNLGFSLQYQIPVSTLLNQYIWNSFLLASVSLVLYWGIALAVGVASAMKPYSLFDHLVTVAVFGAMSFPTFFLCLLLIKWFAVDLHWLPAGGMLRTGSETTGLAWVAEVAAHLLLPVLALVMLQAGTLTRYFRASMLDVIRMDYIRTARAKGLKEKTVIVKHALRNALLPIITLLGFELPALFSGALITEKIFNWPGAGHIHIDSLAARDYPVLMGFTLFLAVLTILGNLLADILYAYADPRIRLR